MADDSGSVGFFAAEILAKTAERQPQKTALITKQEELSFAELIERVQALAAHLQQQP